MINCDSSGPLSLMIVKIWMDPHAGEVAVGRVYSGSIKHGESVWALGAAKAERVQQVSMMVGGDRIAVSEVSAGNIAALTGIKSAAAGVTITRNKDDTGFEPIRHYSEPVVTVAVEPQSMKDLPKFIDALRSLAKADASLQVSTNAETGEALLAGMGELHLEITTYRIEEEQGIKVKVSEPIVVYRESIEGNNTGRPFEGKSQIAIIDFILRLNHFLRMLSKVYEMEILVKRALLELKMLKKLEINLLNSAWIRI